MTTEILEERPIEEVLKSFDMESLEDACRKNQTGDGLEFSQQVALNKTVAVAVKAAWEDNKKKNGPSLGFIDFLDNVLPLKGRWQRDEDDKGLIWFMDNSCSKVLS